MEAVDRSREFVEMQEMHHETGALDSRAQVTSRTTAGSALFLRSLRDGGLSELSSFIAKLERRVAALQNGPAGRKALAQQTLSVLRELLLRETGASSLEENADIFFRNLWESGPLKVLFFDLFREARAVLAGAGVQIGSAFSNPAKLQSELEAILSWYSRRKMSLCLLAEEALPGDPAECFFGLEVFHDRLYAGVKGLEVSFGLRLIGREGQALWIKVFVRRKGRLVSTAENWRLWSDNTDSLALVHEEERQDFTALAPVNPDCQRQMLEGIKIFVPYQALALPAGRQEVEIDCGLYDERGERILRLGRLEEIFMPAELGSEKRGAALIPSPQALGVWPKDFVSGDWISELKISRGVRSSKNTVHEVINVALDCDICGHAGERVFIECRLLYPDGTLVESQAECFTAEGAFAYRLELYPQRPVVRLFNMQLELPLRALSLEPGKHSLLAEVAMLGPRGQVLCGTVQSFVCEVLEALPAAGDESAFLPALPAADPYSGLIVSGFEAGLFPPLDEQLERPDEEMLRVQVYACLDNWPGNVFRVVAGLETLTGKALVSKSKGEPLLRTLHLGGYSSPREKRLVFDFDCLDIDFNADGENPPPDKKTPAGRWGEQTQTLVARARILTLDDKVLFNLSRECSFVPRSSSPERRVNEDPASELKIVDVIIDALLASRTVKCTFTFVVNFMAARAAQGTLYCEIIDAQGRSLKQAVLEEDPEAWPGTAVRIDFSPKINAALYRAGLFQEEVHMDLDVSRLVESGKKAVREAAPNSAFCSKLPENSYYLKAVLFGCDGRLLQSIRRPLSVASLHFEQGVSPAKQAGVVKSASLRGPRFLQNLFS